LFFVLIYFEQLSNIWKYKDTNTEKIQIMKKLLQIINYKILKIV
jgi:hypothetical protein